MTGIADRGKGVGRYAQGACIHGYWQGQSALGSVMKGGVAKRKPSCLDFVQSKGLEYQFYCEHLRSYFGD